MSENGRPLRVLQATVRNDRGGLTGYICQNYRKIDRKEIQFDFLTSDELKAAGYEIDTAVKKIEKIYEGEMKC